MQLVERDASLEHFLVVDRDGLLGLVGLKGRADSRYFGPLPGGGYEAVGIVSQIAGRVAAFVLDHDREAGAGAQSRYRGRSERVYLSRVDLIVELLVEPGRDLPGRHLALAPVFQSDENQAAVRRLVARQNAESGNGGHRLNVVVPAQDGVDPVDRLLGPVQRGGFRQLYVRHQIALILVGQESGGNRFQQKQHGYDGYRDENQRSGAVSNHDFAGFQVAVYAPAETAVEPAEKSFGFFPALRSQQDRTERRAQRQGIDTRQRDADGNRDGELSVQLAGRSGHQADGQKDGHQYRGRRNDRGGYRFHRGDRRVFPVHAFFDVDLHRFHDDDRVVDDQTDSEYQAEQREDVDRKTEQRKDHECPDQRDRNRDDRHDRGPNVLQEQVDDQDDQQQCQSERDDDIVDAEQDRPGRVDDRVIVHSLGERLRELPHRGVDLLTYLDGIAARRLVDHDHAGGLLLVGRVDVVSLRAQLDVGHVFQIHERPVRLGA